MPIYEYKCNGCGQRFDMLQKINEEPLSVCIHCGGHVKKLISAPAFQFKGNGWYVTDYRNKKDEGKNRDEAVQPAQDTSDEKVTKKEDKKNVA